MHILKRKKKLTKEEQKLVKEMDFISEEIKKHPEVINIPVPPSLWIELKRDIDEHKAEKKMTEHKKRDQELIRLGLVYERKRKFRKYYVLAAVFILAMAFGITSFGGPEKFFHNVKTMIAGREQEIVDSESMIPNEYVTEDEAMAQIEEKIGTYPVQLNYLPEGIEFLEINNYDELQGINVYYGNGDTANIIYTIRPNYRESSWVKDVEDELIDEYEIEMKYAVIKVKEYAVQGSSKKWIAFYEYKDIQYSLSLFNMDKDEATKIIENLIFMR